MIRSPTKPPNTRARINSGTIDSEIASNGCSCDFGKLFDQIAELKQICILANEKVAALQTNIDSLVIANTKANEEIAQLNHSLSVAAKDRAKHDRSTTEDLKATIKETLYSEIAKTSSRPPSGFPVDVDVNDVRRQQTIVGSCPSDADLGLKVVARKETILVSQLNPLTEVAELKSFLDKKLKQSGDSIRCKILIPKGKDRGELNFVGFMVSIPDILYERVMSPTFWPSGVIVRDFLFRPKPRTQPGTLLLDDEINTLPTSVATN